MSELVASSGGHDLDKWIERLYDCKPLSEAEVKSLCEQVRLVHFSTNTLKVSVFLIYYRQKKC